MIKPIELRSRFKGLELQLRPGWTEWLNAGKTKISHAPVYLRFERGHASVNDRLLERVGWTRDEALKSLRSRAGSDFFIVEDIPTGEAQALSPKAK